MTIKEGINVFNLFGNKTETIGMQEALDSMKSDGSTQLVDVRSPQEYAAGHIPGAISLPLDELGKAAALLPDPKARIFVYCLSGGRSSMAVSMLKRGGYADVHNIGGITAYQGKLER